MTRLHTKLANTFANRLIQANLTNNFERLVEINEIIFHVSENFEMFDKNFNKKLWCDYIDMIAYGIPLKPKAYYKEKPKSVE